MPGRRPASAPETQSRPKNWEICGDVNSVHDSAADHAAIFVDINI
jgi:hypothetical protein